MRERTTLLCHPWRAGWIAAAMLAAGLGLARPTPAQEAEEPARVFSEDELEDLVGPIALYPDDLIAIILPAATYPLDVVEAARFLDALEDDPTLEPDSEWDDSIVALLNYPDVLRLMDEDLDWTWDLGEAFLSQRADVFDAVQRFRAEARAAGNLETDEHRVVTESEGVIEVEPADPKVIYVPYYEPRYVIVHHHAPIHYFPRPYPVYYYPYPAGYSFHAGFFFGVTTAFTIGWHTHFLHAHHHLHFGHPYFRHHYYDPFFVRRSVSINIVNVQHVGTVWRPRHRHGVRPHRVAITRHEGRVGADYGTRRYVTRGSASPDRTIGAVRSFADSREAVRRVAEGSSRSVGSARSASRATPPRIAGTARSALSRPRAGTREEARARSGASRSIGTARTSRSIGAMRGTSRSIDRSIDAARGSSRSIDAARSTSRSIARGTTRSIGATRSANGRSMSTRSASRAPARSTARSVVRSTGRSAAAPRSTSRSASTARSGGGSRMASRSGGVRLGGSRSMGARTARPSRR